jgi:putative transposase
METTPSRTNLSDAEWALLQPLRPPDARTGRPRRHDRRTIMHALLYVLRTGCAGRRLPTDWPPWQTVSASLSKWRRDGTGRGSASTRYCGSGCAASWGGTPSRAPAPSRASRSRQRASVGRAATTGRSNWSDASAMCWWIPRGCSSRPSVHPATSMDRAGIKLVLDAATRPPLPRMAHRWLDAGYNGRGKGSKGKDWVEQTLGWRVETVKAVQRSKRSWVPNDIPPEQIDWAQYLPAPGFHVIPRRWVVERTFAWLSHNRRLSKEYERLCATSETGLSRALSRLMLRRLARLS